MVTGVAGRRLLAFVALTLVAVNVDLPVWQRVVGWAVACLALGLAVGVVSRRRVP